MKRASEIGYLVVKRSELEHGEVEAGSIVGYPDDLEVGRASLNEGIEL